MYATPFTAKPIRSSLMRPFVAVLLAVVLLGGCAPSRPGTSDRSSASISPDTLPVLPTADRVRLAEAFRLADAVGDRVWAGWSGAPFAILLVTPEHEFLLRHPRPSDDFTPIGRDSLLATDVFVRPRTFPPTLLATFPAVGGVPTIVVGQADGTGRTSTHWVLTVLHEHFHQLQYSQPGYYEGVAALDLAGGDTTGMWMLDYPFPYDSSAVQARFAALAHALDSALTQHPSSGGARDPRELTRTVSGARARLRVALAADDDRYMAFQMWQEGVARYTELQVARLAAGPGYVESDAFRALPDHVEYATAAAEIEQGIRTGLRDVELGASRRVAFYPAGAAMALVLDIAVPGWRARYLAQDFSLEPLLP